jgi:hypothetical protein
MEGIARLHLLLNCDYEPLVMGGDSPSVSFLGIYFVSLHLPSCYASAIIQKFTPDDINEAHRAFNNLGPTARLCISFVENSGQLAFISHAAKVHS